jgi:hypothetical protein
MYLRWILSMGSVSASTVRTVFCGATTPYRLPSEPFVECSPSLHDSPSCVVANSLDWIRGKQFEHSSFVVASNCLPFLPKIPRTRIVRIFFVLLANGLRSRSFPTKVNAGTSFFKNKAGEQVRGPCRKSQTHRKAFWKRWIPTWLRSEHSFLLSFYFFLILFFAHQHSLRKSKRGVHGNLSDDRNWWKTRIYQRRWNMNFLKKDFRCSALQNIDFFFNTYDKTCHLGFHRKLLNYVRENSCRSCQKSRSNHDFPDFFISSNKVFEILSWPCRMGRDERGVGAEFEMLPMWYELSTHQSVLLVISSYNLWDRFQSVVRKQLQSERKQNFLFDSFYQASSCFDRIGVCFFANRFLTNCCATSKTFVHAAVRWSIAVQLFKVFYGFSHSIHRRYPLHWRRCFKMRKISPPLAKF